MRTADSVMVLLAAVALAASARADVGPAFLRPKRLDIAIRFENLDAYPTHDFYIKYGLFPGSPNHVQLLKVTTNPPVHVWNHRVMPITPVYLVAVPRGHTLERPAEPTDRWLTEAPPGGVQSAELTADDSGTPVSMDFDGAEIMYRIHLDGDTLEAVWVSTLYRADPRTYICISLAVSLSIALAAGGLLFRYALRRRPSENTAKPAEPI